MPSKAATKIREFLHTKNLDALPFPEREAIKILLFQQRILIGEPVMAGEQIVPSPSLEEATPERQCIFSRPSVVEDGMLTLFWQDEPARILHTEEGEKRLVKHAPADLLWHDKDYILVAETHKKSFYFPNDEIPDYIRPWLTNLPQERANLSTLLKRQGIDFYVLLVKFQDCFTCVFSISKHNHHLISGIK